MLGVAYLPLAGGHHGGQPAALPGVHEQEDHVVLGDQRLQLLHVLLGLRQRLGGEVHRVAGHGDAHVVALGVLQVRVGGGGWRVTSMNALEQLTFNLRCLSLFVTFSLLSPH